MEISGKTKVLGIMGNPVTHSLSPFMHNTASRLLGIDYIYLGFPVEKGMGEQALQGMRSLNIRGVSVTMPLKQEVIPFLDHITPEAALMNAVNTIVNTKGVLTGTNTDGYGMIKSIQEKGGKIQKSALCIFGTGGAATAIGVQGILEGARKIYFVGRGKEPSKEFTQTVEKILLARGETELLYGGVEDKEYVEESMKESSILVNATPLGMHPLSDQSPVEDISLITPNHLVADAVYYPKETVFLKNAREQGAVTVTGIDMLLWQGAKAFQLFTGRKMPLEEVKKIICKEG